MRQLSPFNWVIVEMRELLRHLRLDLRAPLDVCQVLTTTAPGSQLLSLRLTRRSEGVMAGG